MQNEGLKIILSGPSGSGKGTIVKALLQDDQFVLSISATTRNPRPGEEDGTHYFFKSKKDFEAMIADNQLLEYACFCDNYYGTPKAFIVDTVKKGKDVLLEIEVQGALQVKSVFPDAIFVFIMPPTMKELRSRLIGRNTETPDIIEKRLERAIDEVAQFKEYDYIVINDDLQTAVEAIKHIVSAEKAKSYRYKRYIDEMLSNK